MNTFIHPFKVSLSVFEGIRFILCPLGDSTVNAFDWITLDVRYLAHPLTFQTVNTKIESSHRDLLMKYLFDGGTFLENAYLFEA